MGEDAHPGPSLLGLPQNRYALHFRGYTTGPGSGHKVPELDGRDPGPSTSLGLVPSVTLSVPPASGPQIPEVNSTSLWVLLPPTLMDVKVLLEEIHFGHSSVQPPSALLGELLAHTATAVGSGSLQ